MRIWLAQGGWWDAGRGMDGERACSGLGYSGDGDDLRFIPESEAARLDGDGDAVSAADTLFSRVSSSESESLASDSV